MAADGCLAAAFVLPDAAQAGGQLVMAEPPVWLRAPWVAAFRPVRAALAESLAVAGWGEQFQARAVRYVAVRWPVLAVLASVGRGCALLGLAGLK